MKRVFLSPLLAYVLFIVTPLSASAFVKLLAVGSRAYLKVHNKTFNMTFKFHQPNSPTNQSMNFEFDILKQINELKLDVNYYATALNGTVKNALIKRSVDICFFIRQPKSNRLLNSLYECVKARSRLPARCPMVPGSYYMRDLRLSDFPIPAFLPESEFMLEEVFYSGLNLQKIVVFQLYGKLVRVFDV